jgi:hypothetical protein
MRQTVIILIIFLFSLPSCNKSSNYKPEGLTKLSDAELIERARNRTLITEKTIFMDTLGNIIPREDLKRIDQEEFFGDQYVNADNEIIEIVVRKATNHDKELIRRIKEAFEEGKLITIVDIDCSKVQEILETIYETDQGNRQEGSVGNSDIDRENQQTVVSVIENCGFPTAKEHGHKSVQAIFLVIQHAGKGLREKYFPFIKKSADKGDLQWSTVALMEDRMLMDRGEKQKYGSQVRKENGSDEWTLYPIQDPENVNQRRAKIGLGPIEEYLKHFGVEYKIDK